MKRYLPILTFMLFALVSCNNGPATYQSSNESNLIKNSSKFVNQVEKTCAKYSEEEWVNSTKDFVHMCKDYMSCKDKLSPADDEKFSEIRIKYTDVVAKNTEEEFLLKTKELYNIIEKESRP